MNFWSETNTFNISHIPIYDEGKNLIRGNIRKTEIIFDFEEILPPKLKNSPKKLKIIKC
jgi:hypothetical protein